ncbi:MAG: homoserine O-acetyltransferase [Spirochaetae bacterium HGW-Spirochaetae-6]|nr:MAG: homoserine O-acetyltransferase [Spirochaetae bacterium HGW-Spirochaetae-6]
MAESIEKTKTHTYHCSKPLLFVSGLSIERLDIAYETYGKLNAQKNNAILVLHALSGDAHAAGISESGDKVGWWDELIGPGKPLDTERYFVICSNILGSCYGTTGPSSLDPKTDRAYGLDFPVLTVRDMVNAQKRLVEALGVNELYAVIGGSLGGMQALEWSLLYPEMVKSAIVIAATAKMTSQNIAFNEIGRQAILNDPFFHDGAYYDKPTKPDQGLGIARMVAHITYLSEESMDIKFGRDLRKGKYMFDLKHIDFEVQSYLHYQGNKFVQRFDANSYLYITKAMDYFDVTYELTQFHSDTKFLVLSFSSDWLFSDSQSLELVNALRRNRNAVSYVNLPSREGHDSFLLNFTTQGEVIANFLAGVKIA